MRRSLLGLALAAGIVGCGADRASKSEEGLSTGYAEGAMIRYFGGIDEAGSDRGWSCTKLGDDAQNSRFECQQISFGPGVGSSDSTVYTVTIARKGTLDSSAPAETSADDLVDISPTQPYCDSGSSACP